MAVPTLIYVNGVAIKTPKSLEYQRYDLDSEEGSGRNQNGMMTRDRVAIKVKLVCKFAPMTVADCSTLLKQVKDASMTVKYWDMYENSYRTMTAYVGDRTAPVMKYDPDKKEWWVSDVSFNFIEF